MAEIDVTPILTAKVYYMSASQAALGVQAGRITWSNCLLFAREHRIITDENRDDVRAHFQAYGAWDEDEVIAWTDEELGALVWQEAAADTREFQELCDRDVDAYRALCEKGVVSGRLFVGDDGQTATFYVGG